MGSKGLIAFMSDFGVDSIYPGIVRGAIRKIGRDITVMDITHSVPPFDVELGAFFLQKASGWYPGGTIFLAVVDPGVGGARRPILIETENYFFVGPDNGLLFPAASGDEIVSAYSSFRREYTYDSLCETFHGRDIFAPIAAHLASGVQPASMGEAVETITPAEIPGAESIPGGVAGKVVFIDSFGNAVTSIPGSYLDGEFSTGKLEVNGERAHVSRSYELIRDGYIGLIQGSFGTVEISIYCGNAASRMKLTRGDRIEVVAT